MNIYRWENSWRVVEIAAKTLEQARNKALAYGDDATIAMLTLGAPGDVRQCSKAGLAEDCVKTWTKH